MVCVGVVVKHTMYQREVDVNMLNAVKSVLADVSSVSKEYINNIPCTSKTYKILPNQNLLIPLQYLMVHP